MYEDSKKIKGKYDKSMFTTKTFIKMLKNF